MNPTLPHVFLQIVIQSASEIPTLLAIAVQMVATAARSHYVGPQKFVLRKQLNNKVNYEI
jgi:hypothetical protein